MDEVLSDHSRMNAANANRTEFDEDVSGSHVNCSLRD